VSTLWPKPGSTTSAGLKTATPPTNLKWLARLLDSNSISELHQYPGTLRARKLIRVPSGLAANLSWAIVHYDNARLEQRLATGNPMPDMRMSNGEMILSPDGLFKPKDNWPVPSADTHSPISNLTVDDRGVMYLACGFWGWGGIVYRGGGLQSVFYVHPDAALGVAPNPTYVLPFKVGTRYLALASQGNVSALWDVTNLVAPKQLVRFEFGVITHAQASDGRIAAVCEDGWVRTFTPSSLLVGKLVGAFGGVGLPSAAATDGTDFYYTSSALTVLTSDGRTHNVVIPYALNRSGVDWSENYLTLWGVDNTGKTLHVFKTPSLTEIPFGSFWQKCYWQNRDIGFAVPQNSGFDQSAGQWSHGVVVGGRLHTLVGGLWDVWGLETGTGTVTTQPPVHPPVQPPVQPPTPPPVTPPPQPPPVTPPVIPPVTPPPTGTGLTAKASKTTVLVGERFVLSVGGINPMPSGCRWLFLKRPSTVVVGQVAGASTISHQFDSVGEYVASCIVGGLETSPVTITVNGVATVKAGSGSGTVRERAVRT